MPRTIAAPCKLFSPPYLRQLNMAEFDVPFTLDQLRIVRAISEYGSFRKAADKLFISQPAVSLQVQSLERSLEVLLFDRGGRRVVLTEAGHLLVEYSIRILNLSEEACRALVDLQELKRGNLMLGASQTVGTYMMPAPHRLFSAVLSTDFCPIASAVHPPYCEWRCGGTVGFGRRGGNHSTSV